MKSRRLVLRAANVRSPPKPTGRPMSLPAQTYGISDPLKAMAVAGSIDDAMRRRDG